MCNEPRVSLANHPPCVNTTVPKWLRTRSAVGATNSQAPCRRSANTTAFRILGGHAPHGRSAGFMAYRQAALASIIVRPLEARSACIGSSSDAPVLSSRGGWPLSTLPLRRPRKIKQAGRPAVPARSGCGHRPWLRTAGCRRAGAGFAGSRPAAAGSRRSWR